MEGQTSMNNNILIAGRIHKGISYAQYMDRTKVKLLSANINDFNSEELKTFEYTKLNLQRSLRIEKNYSISPELKAAVSGLEKDQTWVVLTEDWCGDSAQTLPYIAKIAESSRKVELSILLRDSNPDIMDLYLTNGTRSIPKLIAFDRDWNEIFQWGPRPQEARDLFLRLKTQDLPKEKIYEQLHLWYANNKGAAIEHEFLALLDSYKSHR